MWLLIFCVLLCVSPVLSESVPHGPSIRVVRGGVSADSSIGGEEEIYSFNGTRVYLSIGDDDPEMNAMGIVSQKLSSRHLWNLDRIDNECGQLNNVYKYIEHDDGVSPVVVYVLDTGVFHHPDLEDRFIGGHSLVDACETSYGDDHGHGTFVATQIAGSLVGSCKKDCLIYSTKVLDAGGSGSSSTVIRGIFHSVQHCQENGYQRCSMNLSLGGGYSTGLNDAAKFATDSGVMMFVAAGNSALDACLGSPASEPSVWTVGASNVEDEMASFSNFGTCVDFYAPGRSVMGGGLDGGYRTKSGTSMASPTAAGLVSKFWLEYPELTASEMHDHIVGLVVTSPATGLPLVVRHHSRTGPTIGPGINATTSDFSGCIKFTTVIRGYTRMPSINFQLLKHDDILCDGVGDNSISGSVNRRLITVGNDDDDESVSRWGAYIVENKIGVPFEIKMEVSNFRLTISFDEVKVFSMVYEGSVDKLKLFSQSSTVVEYSNIITC